MEINFKVPFWQIIYDALVKSSKVVWMMAKIMIPLSFVIKILQQFGLMEYIGEVLAPVMNLMGLPGEMGIVWASAMLVNIYAGMMAYFILLPSLADPLTIAQVTVLSTVLLVAHTFPIEALIANKCGVRLWFVLLGRIVPAILFGTVLNFIYSTFHLLNEPSVTYIQFATESETWLQWLLSLFYNFFIISIIIFALTLFVMILKKYGMMDYINKALYPLVKLLGISKEGVTPIVIGLTMGLAYGGGIIITEIQKGSLKKQEILYAIFFLGLCHSLIEDTLLMMSCGAHISGILIFRVLFSFLLTWLLIFATKKFGYRALITKHSNL
ncbi:MAG: nucleoside recognition domain-containing protein [Bacteroidales bacterium]